MQQYDTPEALRAFLSLCLDPGHGITRSPETLAEVLPEPLARKAIEFAPHLGELRHAAQALDAQAARARRAYADALAAWIHGGQDAATERYVIGRNGVFATLYDRQEERLIVDNATEEYCRRVRDELTAPRTADCEPAPRRSMPLLEAVTAAHDAAVAHATKCGSCWPGMRLAEMCPDGQHEAVSYLDRIDGQPECAHLAWEVTSEHRNELGTWTKFRTCADCGEPLPAVVEPEPHRPGTSRPAAAVL